MNGNREKVTVRVPATSANLGPGYDCLGLALSMYSEFTFEEAEDFSVTGCPEEFRNEDNLVLVAFRRAFGAAGKEPKPVKLSIEAGVPVARGLGSSSTCIAAGVLGADAFLGGCFSLEEKLRICTEMEGHPDNAAPALYGGLTASFMEEGKPFSVPFDCDPAWRFVAIIPDYEVHTAEARKAVPKEMAISKSVYTTSHALAMVKALETGDEGLVGLAARDVLHEPYRKKLIPDYEVLRRLCLAAGAAAFLISGSGSTMLALTKQEDQAEELARAVEKAYPAFQVHVLRACQEGAKVLPV